MTAIGVDTHKDFHMAIDNGDAHYRPKRSAVAYVEISETRYLVKAAWRAGKVPEIYNREAFDGSLSDVPRWR